MPRPPHTTRRPVAAPVLLGVVALAACLYVRPDRRPRPSRRPIAGADRSERSAGRLALRTTATVDRVVGTRSIGFALHVTNTGAVPLSGVVVIDPRLGLGHLDPVRGRPAGRGCSRVLPADLAPGASITCLVAYRPTSTDLATGGVVDVARAYGLDARDRTAHAEQVTYLPVRR